MRDWTMSTPSYFMPVTHGKSEPHEVVKLIQLVLHRGPIRIQHDFSELIDMSSHDSSRSYAVNIRCSSQTERADNIMCLFQFFTALIAVGRPYSASLDATIKPCFSLAIRDHPHVRQSLSKYIITKGTQDTSA
jgi:hypothetical protein